MTRLLGGSASPIGWVVHYVHAEVGTVVDTIRALRPGRVSVRGPVAYPELLDDLPPFEAPWTREIVMPCGEWTAYMNNFVDGGDASAVGPAVSRELRVRCVVAVCSPRHGPGHQSTQLNVLGPDGETPLMYERAIAADAADGRWSWHNEGAPFDFEDQRRYLSRRVRDRFDRVRLLHYLEQLGIPASRDGTYGPGFVIQQEVDYQPRTVSLLEARAALGQAIDSSGA